MNSTVFTGHNNAANMTLQQNTQKCKKKLIKERSQFWLHLSNRYLRLFATDGVAWSICLSVCLSVSRLHL